MKKKYSLFLILFVMIILIIFSITYFVNYKTAEEIQELLAQSEKISNMYVEHYINYGEYSNNIKDYKVDIFIKDNVYIYDVLDRIDYVNYNTNECYSIKNNTKISEIPIEQANKFNDYSEYFNSQLYIYSYNFPYYINNTWCDKITLKNNSNNTKTVIYISKENGLILKIERISSAKKLVETFNYQLNVVTDEQIKSFGI